MKGLNKEKGITLIALIITIIVMLILVAVTINVALNGGIFTRAKDAKEQTQIEADKENLLMAAMANIGEDGKVDFSKLNTEASKLGFSGSNGTYSKDGYTYKIDKNTGKITLAGTSTSEDGDDTYIITAADIVAQGVLAEGCYFGIFPYTKLINIENIEELKSIMTFNENQDMEGTYYYFNNIECSDNTLINVSNQSFPDDDESDDFYFIDYGESDGYTFIMIEIRKDGVYLTDENYTSDAFKDLTFTITK